MKKTKDMCRGCYNDYYNHNRDEGCWSYGGAQVVTRVKVGFWEPPPYSPKRAREFLSCHCPEGYSMLLLDDCRVKETG